MKERTVMLTVGLFFSRPYNPHTRKGPTLLSFQRQQCLVADTSLYSSSKLIPKMDSDDLVPEAAAVDADARLDMDESASRADDADSVGSVPPSPKLSRNHSFSNSSSFQEDWETFPPLDKLSVFDLLGDFDLSQRLEKWHQTIAAQKERVMKQREKLKSTSASAKDRVLDEWKRRAPTAEEQLEKYRRRMKHGVERLGKQWHNTATVTAREKASFIAGVLNVFISGYLIGGFPQYFYIWFSVQLLYFMPIRYYRYHKKGYHYFLADLCYFVNLLAMLSIWVFPSSKRLFISTFCLAFGNNAVAIAMWRNSMVFHSMDKVVRWVCFSLLFQYLSFIVPSSLTNDTRCSLFIHIMPPATFHCLVHLTPAEKLKERFPAIYNIKFSDPGSPEHYSLGAMVTWATIPYAIWQLNYHLFITVRRSDQIAAGRPTSFTWLRKSYAKSWLGRLVLGLPETLQEPAFMLIQYAYAILTMLPCPIWFWSKVGSSLFLSAVFVWSIYNGATYYIDVFGKRFQKELEQLKKDVARWQSSPEFVTSPPLAPSSAPTVSVNGTNNLAESDKASIDRIPPLDSTAATTGAENNNHANPSEVRERD